MSSIGGTLQARRPARVRLWQTLVVAAVLIAGFTMGIFTGRVTATKSEPVAKAEPAIAIVPSELNDRAAELRRQVMRGMNRILEHEVPICEPCVARYENRDHPETTRHPRTHLQRQIAHMWTIDR